MNKLVASRNDGVPFKALIRPNEEILDILESRILLQLDIPEVCHIKRSELGNSKLAYQKAVVTLVHPCQYCFN